MHLYFGYLLVQVCLLAVKIFQFNMSISALFFSVVVVLFWSFIPVVGYLLAKLFKANGKVGKYILFTFGFVIALIEKSLFYFEFLTKEQVTIGTFVAFILFFIAAFISMNKTANKQINQN
ncbi:hypothetical protein [Candidatus Colwellia aromaticivorans]|uniref:hypothetical protein n=1 Tax=Candidatus Colwellia aromaticivorans TaxID=2267621 RepID=UPI000DF49B81|nr:hypothetical protein [Candidatus Colwellia aromaticivorans]